MDNFFSIKPTQQVLVTLNDGSQQVTEAHNMPLNYKEYELIGG